MRTFRNAVLAGAAAVVLSGAFGVAAAKDQATHTMTVRLPGGAVEQIRYTGEVAPKVAIEPDARLQAFGFPAAFFDPAPFAAIDRISAELDRRMTETMRRADALAAQSFPASEGPAGLLPAGSQSFSFVSTGGGKVFCARSVEVISRGRDRKPRVVSRSYGNCGNAAARPGTRTQDESAARGEAARSIDYMLPRSGAMLREAAVVR